MNEGRVIRMGILSHLSIRERGASLRRKKFSSGFEVILDFFIFAYYGNRDMRRNRKLGCTVNLSFFHTL